MCNRAAAFDIEEDYGFYGYDDYVDFTPQYHIFAHETKSPPRMSIILPDNKFHLCDWGLIPEWVTDWKQAVIIRQGTVQAKDTSLITPKKSFANALAKKRFCIIPVNGFFEHQDFMKKSYPYYIYLKNRKSFCIAGIYDVWLDQDSGEEITSFAMITCVPNDLMARIHNGGLRMPVILKKEDEQKWLKEGDLSLLVPYENSEMEAYPVSKILTDRNKDANVPMAIEKKFYPELQFEQTSLF